MVVRSNYHATPGGISKRNRRLLEHLHQTTQGPFSSAEAAEVLDLDRSKASALLRYLARRGWLARVRRGLYVPVPLEARTPGEWHEDPWIVAAQVFAPCYIGGWSAAEHWGLTDQLFREVIVVSGRRVRERHVEIQGTPMRVKVVADDRLFGAVPVWRGRVQVTVSDPSRTIVDVLDEPGLGGGIRHVSEMLEEYFAGELRADDSLLAYAERLGNRTVFKRLGYLLEALAIEAEEVVDSCLRRRSSGITDLDPAVRRKGRISTRWNLRINVSIEEQVAAR
jgi:predicted transcriptional regulator of viral defense system